MLRRRESMNTHACGTFHFLEIDETESTRLVRLLVNDDLNVFDSTKFVKHI